MERLHDERGYSLIEVLMAMAIFSYGMLAVAGLLITAIEGNTMSREVTDVSTIATQQLELLMTLPYYPDNDDNTHADIKDTDNDGTGGIDDTYSGSTITADNYLYYDSNGAIIYSPSSPPSDPEVQIGDYGVFWNIADGDVISGAKTIKVTVIGAYRGGTKNVSVQAVKTEQ